MSQDIVEFKNRLRRLERKHTAMSRGYDAHMRADGLIVIKPKRSAPAVSGRAVIVFLLAFIVFKGFMLASIGIDGYDERVERLRQGTVVEQAGAWVMQRDPLSQFIAEKMGPILR
jgi:hypothetical protein